MYLHEASNPTWTADHMTLTFDLFHYKGFLKVLDWKRLENKCLLFSLLQIALTPRMWRLQLILSARYGRFSHPLENKSKNKHWHLIEHVSESEAPPGGCRGRSVKASSELNVAQSFFSVPGFPQIITGRDSRSTASSQATCWKPYSCFVKELALISLQKHILKNLHPSALPSAPLTNFQRHFCPPVQKFVHSSTRATWWLWPFFFLPKLK